MTAIRLLLPSGIVAAILPFAHTTGTAAAAQPATFTSLGESSAAPHVSADGSTVVLDGRRWRPAEGFSPLENPSAGCPADAIGLTRDGARVVGSVGFGEDCFPLRTVVWDAGGAATVADIPGYPVGITSDGGIIAGNWSPPGCGVCIPPRLALVADPGGWSFLPLADGAEGAEGAAIAGAAPVVVGCAFPPAPAAGQACRWDLVNDEWRPALLAPGPSIARAVSADGRAVALETSDAIYLLRDGYLTSVSVEPGQPLAMSASGDTIVGLLFQTETDGAFIWTEASGLQSLARTLSMTYGLDLDGWSLDAATGISDDGRTIVGSARHEYEPGRFRGEAWVVQFGPLCRCDFDEDGTLDSGDFFAFLVAFFGGFSAADFNGDTVVNSQDVFDFLGCFFSPPAGCG